MSKLLIAVSFLALLVQPALAGNNNNQFENWQKNRNHQQPPGDHLPPPPNGGTWNYNYTYKYKNNNGDWYQNPYLWGSVAGAVGQLLRPPPQYGAPPYPGGVGGPECGMFWTQVFIPGKGYVPYQTVVCP